MFLNLKKINEKVIIFEFPEFNFIEEVSTYYYYLDSNFNNITNENLKIVNVLYNLLSNWLICLESNEEFVFLPFDFEDEYVSFFKIYNELNSVKKLQVICSRDFNGYSVIPSKVKFKNKDLENCELANLSSDFTINLDDFINDIKIIINDIRIKNKKSEKILWYNIEND